MTGDAYWLSVEVPAERSAEVMELLKKSGKVTLGEKEGRAMLLMSTPAPIDAEVIEKLKSEKELFGCFCAIPSFSLSGENGSSLRENRWSGMPKMRADPW